MKAKHLEGKCVLLVEIWHSKEVPDAECAVAEEADGAAAAESAAAAELEVVVRGLQLQGKARLEVVVRELQLQAKAQHTATSYEKVKLPLSR